MSNKLSPSKCVSYLFDYIIKTVDYKLFTGCYIGFALSLVVSDCCSISTMINMLGFILTMVGCVIGVAVVIESYNVSKLKIENETKLHILSENTIREQISTNHQIEREKIKHSNLNVIDDKIITPYNNLGLMLIQCGAWGHDDIEFKLKTEFADCFSIFQHASHYIKLYVPNSSDIISIHNKISNLYLLNLTKLSKSQAYEMNELIHANLYKITDESVPYKKPIDD